MNKEYNDYQRKELEEAEIQLSRHLFWRQMKAAICIVVFLSASVAGMKIGLELNSTRIIKDCETKKSVKIRDIEFQCVKSKS